MSVTEAVHVGPHAGALDWLASHGVEYELREHPVTITARETARVEGIDPRRFAKTIGVRSDDDRRALMVVDAADRLDLVRAREVLHSGSVRLLDEEELLALAPDCEVGTLPPIGELFGVPVFADYAIRDDPEITFHAGSHAFTLTVDRAQWARAVGVVYGDLSVDVDERPAWASS
jgi:Ala-tRNA(Pro) deacylase